MDSMSSPAGWHPVRFPSRVILLAQFLLLAPSSTNAIPSFARQTGQACSACHIQAFGPNLTPFGRVFKLSGYIQGQEMKMPPLSVMIRGSFTQTAEKLPPGEPGEDFSRNNNNTLDEVALFYAGRITSNVGAFIQLTYASGLEDTLVLDNTDIRFADIGTLAGGSAIYGISFNNSPTVQDPWNTTPVWGFPSAVSPLAPTPAAEMFIDGLGGQVGGVTGYVLWNNVFYGEFGLYSTLPRGTQHALNTFDPGEYEIDGAAAYWRAAYVREWGSQYFSVGHLGLYSGAYPERDSSAGSDSYTDLGIDATYQYLGDYSNIFEIKGSIMHERGNLGASQALGLASNSSDSLRKIKLDGSYTYHQTYGLTAALFRISGTHDTARYDGSPDSQGYIVEIDYMPFGKQDSYGAPWVNLRLGLNYTGYSRFDGSKSGAGDNNTLLLNAWLAF